MEYGDYLKILARLLQILGLIFSSTAILGEKRLKKLNALGRKFRKLVKIRLFLRVTKSFISMTLLILLGLLIVVVYPISFLPELFSTAPPDAGEGFIYVMLMSFIMTVILYLGMAYIAVSSISATNIITIYINRFIAFLRDKCLNISWWGKFSQSRMYIVFYYLLYLPFYVMIISPLRTMHLLLDKGSVKVVVQSQLEQYEQLFLPSSMITTQIPKRQSVWQSMSWERYLDLFQFLGIRQSVLAFLVFYFYPIYILIILELWFTYYYFMFVGVFLSPLLFTLYFLMFYVVLWLVINTTTLLLSTVLFILTFPYRVFELLRIKARLRSSLLTLGLFLELLGILIDQ